MQATEIQRLRDLQAHRGPDSSGMWLADDQRIGFGHRRLSIIDLSERGHQPMWTADGRFCITFNGEIYNHQALKSILEARGTKFRSNSDTEVILHGYREWGADVLHRLRGMFAFGIWDAQRRELFLARDPLGIKPLFYHEGSGRISFASEPRALARTLGAGDVDPLALVCFLLWGSIASPMSLYRDIRALEPGCWIRVSEEGDREEGRYWRVEEAFQQEPAPRTSDADELIGSALRDSVRHHLVADVPVGAFLSGGVDSASLVGLLTEARPGGIETVTLRFDVPELDEGDLARMASDLYGTRHHEIHLDIGRARDRIPAAIEAMGQPTIDGINTYFVSEAAVQAGLKVAISGVGGDELFGGYDTFGWIPRILSMHRRMSRLPGVAPTARFLARRCEGLDLSRSFGRVSRALAHGATPGGAYYATRGIFSPADVQRLLSREVIADYRLMDPATWLERRVQIDRIADPDRVSVLELRQYLQSQLLRDTDAASMAHSLEVRTPLVDRDLLMLVSSVPAEERLAGPAKRCLRQAPNPPVPDALWNRQKQGFTLPFDHWIRSGSLDLDLPADAALDRDAVDAAARQFRAGRLHWSRYWALLVLGHYLCRL